MNNKFKRLLAVLFSLSMVFCLMSANAWATDPRTDPATLYVDDNNGENHFNNLATAVSNAIDGDTITLGKNVELSENNGLTVSKSVKLDLNGKTITTPAADGFTVTEGATLTVEDESGSGKITQTGSDDAVWVKPGGTLIVNGGTIKGNAYGIYSSVGATVTLNGGTVAGKQGISISGAKHENDAKTKLTVGSNATINAVPDTDGNCWGIAIYPQMYNQTGNDHYANGLTIDINGTVNGNVFVNGDTHYGNSVINVNRGAVINSNTDIGMAINGFMTVNVEDGATVTGGTGIEVRAGNLNVSGGTITGTAQPTTVNPNGSGTTTDGAGIAVAQHTTKLPIDVNISGGSITGYSAIYESNPQNNSAEDLAKITLSITGGTFATNNDGKAVVYSEDKTKFITGGTFSKNPGWVYGTDGNPVIEDDEGNQHEKSSGYLADGYAAVQKVNNEQLENLWTVGCAINLNQNRPEAVAGETRNRQVVGKAGAELELPVDGDIIEWASDANESGHETHNYSLSGWTLTGWATTQEVTANEKVYTGSFTIPAAWATETNPKNKVLYGRWTVNAPAAPTVASITSDSITVNAEKGVEYNVSKDAETGWKSAQNNAATVTLDGLEAQTEYTVYARRDLTGEDADALKSVVERKTAETKATTSAKPTEVKTSNDKVAVVTESTAVAATPDEKKGIVASEDNDAATITVEQATAIASGTEAVSGLEDAQVVQDIVNGDYNKVDGVDAPAKGNKLFVVPSINVQTKSFSVEDDKKVLELDISATYSVYEANAGDSVAKAKATGTVKVENIPLDTTDKVVTLKIKLPANFAKEGETLYVKHPKTTGKNKGKTFMYEARVIKDGNDLYAQFDNPDGFSPFYLQTTPDGAPYLVNGTPKNTLKEAVEAVLAATGTDLTIKVATNTDVATETDIITVNQKTTFKIDATGNNTVSKTLMEQRIVAGTGIIRTLTEASGVYTFTFEYPGTIIVPSDPTPTTTKPAAPATPVIKEVTDKSIVVNAVAGVEYSIDGGKTWKSAKAGEATVTFDGLTPETMYTVSARVAKTDKAEASDVVTVNATTKKTETATGTDTPTPGPATGTDTPTPVPTPAPTNPTYDNLSSKEKKNAKAVAKALGVDNETAAQMIKEAAKLGVSIDTVKLGTKTILALKNDNDPKGADFGKLTARATKRTNKAVTLGWKKQKNADGYMIYGNVCGKKYKLLKTIKKKGTTSWTQKKLKKGTNYKYLVVAYKNVNGEKMPIAAAVVVHTNTKGGKVTVAKSLKLNKTKVTVKKGKSFTLKATEVKEDKNLKIKSHRKVKFESSNKKIAKVSSKGKITGVKKGTVTIFAYAQNGIYKTVKVTVK